MVPAKDFKWSSRMKSGGSCSSRTSAVPLTWLSMSCQGPWTIASVALLLMVSVEKEDKARRSDVAMLIDPGSNTMSFDSEGARLMLNLFFEDDEGYRYLLPVSASQSHAVLSPVLNVASKVFDFSGP